MINRIGGSSPVSIMIAMPAKPGLVTYLDLLNIVRTQTDACNTLMLSCYRCSDSLPVAGLLNDRDTQPILLAKRLANRHKNQARDIRDRAILPYIIQDASVELSTVGFHHTACCWPVQFFGGLFRISLYYHVGTHMLDSFLDCSQHALVDTEWASQRPVIRGNWSTAGYGRQG